MRSSVDCITTTSESEFSVHTGTADENTVRTYAGYMRGLNPAHEADVARKLSLNTAMDLDGNRRPLSAEEQLKVAGGLMVERGGQPLAEPPEPKDEDAVWEEAKRATAGYIENRYKEEEAAKMERDLGVLSQPLGDGERPRGPDGRFISDDSEQPREI